VTVSEYIAENGRRKAELHAPYDPLRGLGSHVPRFPFAWDDNNEIFLPRIMENVPVVNQILEAGSLKAYAHEKNIPWEEAKSNFSLFRTNYDFEFWAATGAIIKDKETAELIPFVFNPPQRRYTWELERQRWNNKPVREIVLKHRQWGCTTYTYTYIAWHQLVLYRNRDAWFIGLDKEAGEDVVQRYTVILKDYPYDSLTFRAFGKSTSARQIPERNAVINRPHAPVLSSLRGWQVALQPIGKCRERSSERRVNDARLPRHDYDSRVNG
jgi:hypothetical protein